MLKNWKWFLDCLHTLKCFLPTYPQKSQGLCLDTWKISSWAIFKLSMSESKRGGHEVGVGICHERRKRHFALSFLIFELFTVAQHGSPKLWGFCYGGCFSTKSKITLELKPGMSGFSASYQGILQAGLFGTIELALLDANQITCHCDKQPPKL